MRSIPLAVLLFSCTPADSPVSEHSDTDTSTETEDSTPTSPLECFGTPPDPDATAVWLFDDTRVHQIDIYLDKAGIDALWDLPFEKVEGCAVIDGIVADELGIRLRGKIGSFREIDEKPKWKFDFNWIDDDQRFYGLESLSLNNSIMDCSYLREKLAYAVYGNLGLIVPRVTWAKVTFNGEDYGLYQVLEHPDDRFLKRVMEDRSGNLYDAKYLWQGGWNAELLDFLPGLVEKMVLEEGVDVGNADLIAVSDAIIAGEAGDWLTETEPVVNWESLHLLLAAEQYVDQWDGYGMNKNNYRVWVDPETEKIELIPWDLDLSFGTQFAGFPSWDTGEPIGALAAGCLADPTCAADHALVLADAIDTLEAIDYTPLLEAWDALTVEDAKADPRSECSSGSIVPDRDSLYDWMRDRPDELRADL